MLERYSEINMIDNKLGGIPSVREPLQTQVRWCTEKSQSNNLWI